MENQYEQKMLQSSSTISIVIGIISNPGISVIALITLLGIYLFIKGIIDFISIFSSKNKHRGLTIFASIVGIIAGIVILAHPLISSLFASTFFVWVIAFSLIVNGIASMSESVLFGIISLIVGVIFLFASVVSITIGLVWIIGLFLLFGGIFSIAAGAGFNLEAKKIA